MPRLIEGTIAWTRNRPRPSTRNNSQLQSEVASALVSADTNAVQTVQNVQLVQQARLTGLKRAATAAATQYGGKSPQAQKAQAAVSAATNTIGRISVVPLVHAVLFQIPITIPDTPLPDFLAAIPAGPPAAPQAAAITLTAGTNFAWHVNLSGPRGTSSGKTLQLQVGEDAPLQRIFQIS